MGQWCNGLRVNATHARRQSDRFLRQQFVVRFRRLRHDVGNLSEQFVDLRFARHLRAATAGVILTATAATAQVAIAFNFAALARDADRFGLAAGDISRALSTCPLRSQDRHRLNHYCSDQTKIDGGAN